MIPDPLHPAVVHIPIAMAVVLPIVILYSFVVIKRGASLRVAWLPVLLLSAVLFSGALLAKNSGEDEEEAVEEVVSARYIEDHEENAESFTLVAGILFALAIGGLFKQNWALYSRAATAAASVVLIVMAFQTGHSGGELVYKHGAASVAAGMADKGTLPVTGEEEEDHDD
jgi:uncharacterized membrane protein